MYMEKGILNNIQASKQHQHGNILHILLEFGLNRFVQKGITGEIGPAKSLTSAEKIRHGKSAP